MKLIRPCTYAPPGAPCPTHDNGTFPEECVCWWEGYDAEERVEVALRPHRIDSTFWVVLGAIIIAICTVSIVLMISALT